MMNILPAVQSSLTVPPASPDVLQRYLKLCLSYVEYVSPVEMGLETGRLVKLLCQHPFGLTRNELLRQFYPDYPTSSFNRQASLRICLEKVIQRARLCFEKYSLTIKFSKENKHYLLVMV